MDNDFSCNEYDVEMRPIIYRNGCGVISSIKDAECYGIYRNYLGRPASRNAIYDDADDALWYMLHDPRYRDSRKWYDGREARLVVEEKDDIFVTVVYSAGSKAELNALARKLGIDPRISYLLVSRALRRRAMTI